MTIPAIISVIEDLTDAILDELRAEPKKKASSTRPKEKPGHWQQQFEVVAAADPQRQYSVFTRRASNNAAVFSVGLTLLLPDKQLVLCRYNGGYHGHKNILEKTRVPSVCHRHVATERYIAAGLDADGFAEAATGYSTMEEALEKLVRDCDIQGILKPPPSPPEPTPQHPLFQ